MYWGKERDSELEALKGIIDRILDDTDPAAINRVSRDRLVFEIAETVRKHQQHTKPDEKDDLLKEARKENKGRLDEIENSLTGHFSKTAVKKVMAILTEDSERIFDPANYSESVKGFLQFNPKAHAWIEKEDILIGEIRDMFKKYIKSPLEKTSQADLISSIFILCGLWPVKEKPKAIETMRKRFRSHKKGDPKEREHLERLIKDYELCEICGAVKPDCECDLSAILKKTFPPENPR